MSYASSLQEAALEQDIDAIISTVRPILNSRYRRMQQTEKRIIGYDAEDLAAEVELQLFKVLDKYDPTKALFATFVDTVAHNKVESIRRISNKQYWKDGQIIAMLPYGTSADTGKQPGERDDFMVSDIACPESEFNLLNAEMHCLMELGMTEREREVVIFRYGGLDNREIASRMGISEQRVGQLLKSAKARWSENIG